MFLVVVLFSSETHVCCVASHHITAQQKKKLRLHRLKKALLIPHWSSPSVCCSPFFSANAFSFSWPHWPWLMSPLHLSTRSQIWDHWQRAGVLARANSLIDVRLSTTTFIATIGQKPSIRCCCWHSNHFVRDYGPKNNSCTSKAHHHPIIHTLRKIKSEPEFYFYLSAVFSLQRHVWVFFHSI